MNRCWFLVVLALLPINSLSAGESDRDATQDNGKKTESRYVIEPPDVIQIELLKPAVHGSTDQFVSGHYLVGPDGTVNLRQFGVVHVFGRATADACEAIEKHLEQFLDSPRVSVNVVASNSNAYYVIVRSTGQADSVHRFPTTGNETVLDAISQVNRLSDLASKKIWIARLDTTHTGCRKTMTVDWDAIAQGASTATNYQIIPGDHVYILLGEKQKAGPEPERTLGIIGSGSTNCQTMGRNYNRTRNGQ
jgi:protein involved in polysaccharide export with SLBB domain